MLNELKIKGSKPITENLSTLTVGDERTCLEITDKNGARITGDLEVSGIVNGNLGEFGHISHLISLTDSLVIKDSFDTDDYFSITVTTHGATEIATVDDAAAVADLTINPDGDLIVTSGTIDLKPSNGIVQIYDDTVLCGRVQADAGSPNEIILYGTSTSRIKGGAIVLEQTTATETVLIDKNIANTTAGTGIGLHIDYDRTGSVNTGTDIGIGLDLDMNATGGSAVRNVTGIDMDIVSDAAGLFTTTTNIGIDITTSGADTNNGLLMTNTIAGKLYDLRIQSATNTADYFNISTIAEGATTISTVDADTTVGHLTLDIDGSIILDSHDGTFVTKKAGTEFSVANSSYAGMLLGYSMIRNEAGNGNNTDTVITLDQTSFTLIESVEGTKAGVTFIAPPSGKVEVEFSASMYNSQEYVFFGLSTSDSSYTEVEDKHTYDNYGNYYGDETDRFTLTMKWIVEGLTAGTSYTYYIWYKVTAGAAYIYHGESTHHVQLWHMPPVITKVTALPATFSITGD